MGGGGELHGSLSPYHQMQLVWKMSNMHDHRGQICTHVNVYTHILLHCQVLQQRYLKLVVKVRHCAPVGRRG